MKKKMTYTIRNPYGTGDMINNVPEDMLTRIIVVPDWDSPSQIREIRNNRLTSLAK